MQVNELLQIVLLGVGATAVLDLWLLALKRMGIPSLPIALIGRWVGHARRGRLRHIAIRQAPTVAGEQMTGWLFHYAVGIAFAAVLFGAAGREWLSAPTVLPALAVGVSTAVLPLFVMQPAMGAGFASSKTAAPMLNCLKSILSHAIFGLGLYLSAVAANALGI